MRVEKWQALGNHFCWSCARRRPGRSPRRVRGCSATSRSASAPTACSARAGRRRASPWSCTTATARSPRSPATARASPSRYAAERLGRSELRVRTGAGVGRGDRRCADGRISVATGQRRAGRARRRTPHAPDPGRRLPLRLGRQPALRARRSTIPTAFPLDRGRARGSSTTRASPSARTSRPSSAVRSATAAHARLGARRRRDAGLRLGRLRGRRRRRSSTAAARRPVTRADAGGERRGRGRTTTSRSRSTGRAQRVYVGRARRRRSLAAARARRLMRGSRRLDGVPGVPLDRGSCARVAEARARGRRRDLARHRRPRHCRRRSSCARRSARQALRDDVHGYPTNRGLAPLREAVAALLPHALRRRARSRARGHAAARRQGGPRAPLPRPARPGRRRARGRSRLPGLLRRPGARRRRGGRPAAARASTASCPTSTRVARGDSAARRTC